MTDKRYFSPVQMLLSRPDMVKPTSQVQRVEPRKWVQWDGRTEEEGEEDVGDKEERGEGEDAEEGEEEEEEEKE